jgi:flagellar motility protein MotE (MotC chaperone)
MKKLILLGVVVAVLFGISATSSWLLRQQKASTADHGDGTEAGGDKGQKGTPQDVRQAVRSPFNPDADKAAQLFGDLRTQSDALKAREQQFNARQKSLEIIYQDLRAERAALDELRKQCNDELKALADKLESLDRKAGDVDHQRKDVVGKIDDFEKRKVQFANTEQKKTYDRLGTVYDTMDPEAAARLLQHMADTGSIDTAVKILTVMHERQASKVLAAFTDKTTAVQLVDKMQSVDRGSTVNKGGQ